MTLTYTPALNFNGADSFTFRVNDGTLDSNAATVSMTIISVIDLPTVTTTSGSLAYTENDPARAIDSGVTVSAPDSPSIAGATVQITAGCTNTEDLLAFTNTPSITGTLTLATCLLTLTGTDSVANYQAALRSVTYANTSENPTTVARTVTITVNDGANTGSGTRGISVTAVNDAPTNTVPGMQTVNEDTDLTFSTANGNAISVADLDAGLANVQVTVSAANGTITPATGSGASISGSGTPSATITGTLAQANAALNGLTYRGNLNFNSTRAAEVLTIVTNDQGNTGSGGSRSDTDSINITVNAVNDPPTALAKNLTAQANMKINLTGLLGGANDPDTGDGGYTANLTIGTVSATSPAGGTIDNINASAGSLDFNPPPGVTGNVTFTYTVCDTGNPAPGLCSAPATVSVSVATPVIWFVDDTAPAGGDGRMTTPFNTLAAAGTTIGANINQRIFLFAGTYTTGRTLNASEWLIGQGVTGASFDAVMGITPPPGTVAARASIPALQQFRAPSRSTPTPC